MTVKLRPITSVEEPLESSTLSSMWYSAATKRLRVKFKTKNPEVFSVYIYHDVPQDAIDKLRRAESKGMFFHSLIKDKYNTEKVS